MNIFGKVNTTHFLLLSLALLVLLTACSNQAPTVEPTNEYLNPPDRVDVVYFYDSDICHCQIAPGERIQSDLFINFGGELASGKLTYQSIDLATTDNATVAARYGATSQSLFVNIVSGENEQIIAMPELLLVKDDNEAIDRLINNRIREYLDGAE